MIRLKSSLSRHQPITPLNDEEIHALAQRLLWEKNKLLIDLSELFDDDKKMWLLRYAAKKYGRPLK